jgi:lincosamide nucleotidyltransferase A/C/D/E
MDAREVLSLYAALDEAGVRVWVDGGWCVDALLGRETREHADLDVAVGREEAARLVELLAARGYGPQPREDASPWNFVLADPHGNAVDVHVFAFDEHGVHVYGVAYPSQALTGTGVIAGHEVRCVAPEWMFRFKTAYPPAAKDLRDVEALAEAFGFAIPPSHRTVTPSG